MEPMKHWELMVYAVYKHSMWKVNSIDKVIKENTINSYHRSDLNRATRNGKVFIINGLNRWSL